MSERSLTALLNAHHDKLNQHTTEIKDIKHDIEVLQQAVSALEAKLDNSDEDEGGGIRLVLRTWLNQVRELM